MKKTVFYFGFGMLLLTSTCFGIEVLERLMVNYYSTATLVNVGGCQYVVVNANTSSGGVAIIHHSACPNKNHSIKESVVNVIDIKPDKK